MATAAQDVIHCSLCQRGVRRFCTVCKSLRALCENCEEKHIKENGGHLVTDFSRRNDVAENMEGECWVPPILGRGILEVNDDTITGMYAPSIIKNCTQKDNDNEQNGQSAMAMDSLILHEKQLQSDKLPTDNKEPNDDSNMLREKKNPNSSLKSEKAKTPVSFCHLYEKKSKLFSKFHCKTKEQLNVYVYCESILNADVDVLVNAASEDLGHRAGVAALIAKAAGQTLIDESKAFIARNGKLKATEVASTSAGNLHYQFVLHAVGPRWEKYPNKMDCLLDLKQTILNVLEKAQRTRATSIAFPAISAGGFEVPIELCAEIYAASVHEFSKGNGSRGSLRDIHIVDMDTLMVQKIKEAFDNFEKSKIVMDLASMWTTPSRSGRTPEPKSFSKSDIPKRTSDYENFRHFSKVNGPNIPKGNVGSSAKLIRLPDTTMAQIPVTGFQFKNGLIVKIYTGSIEKFHGDAIVISADPVLTGTGSLADSVRKAGGYEYEKEFESMKRRKGMIAELGDIFICKGGTLGARYVMHLVLRHLFSTKDREVEAYKSFLVKALDEINIRCWKKVAMPLIGAGFIEQNMSDLQNCCVSWFSVLSDFASRRQHTCHIGEIHLINHNSRVTSSLIGAFRIDSCEDVDVPKTANALHFRSKSANVSKGSRQEDRGETLNRFSEDFSARRARSWDLLRQSERSPLPLGSEGPIGEKPTTKPNGTMKISKHRSCRVCIQQSFNRQKIEFCPLCGAVYRHDGVQGNQPENGTMRYKVDEYSSLPGYEGHGTIVIKCYFPDGIQGPEHPNPGKPYQGTKRKAFLPNNTEGQKVLRLLEEAFDRRLTFTIGSSLTTGRDNVIIWNNIQHKTKRDAGAQAFGYPDPAYLRRVQTELAAKGVTE